MWIKLQETLLTIFYAGPTSLRETLLQGHACPRKAAQINLVEARSLWMQNKQYGDALVHQLILSIEIDSFPCNLFQCLY